jgi:YVTN family beta-propeller protein
MDDQAAFRVRAPSFAVVRATRLPLLGCAALALLSGLACSSSTKHAAVTRTTHRAAVHHAARAKPRTVAVVERTVGSLSQPLQDAAAAPSGTGAFLLGGLNAADTSVGDVRFVSSHGDAVRGSLPGVRHDAAAVSLGGSAYVFGGGNGPSQLDEIVKVGPAGRTSLVGHLPQPASDVSAAVISGTAYVVGGFTGTRWLNTILAWKPGAAPRVVARLPVALRYAAVTAAGGKLVIAGGSVPSGTASRTVLAFNPVARTVRVLARLPVPVTHAAAATLHGIAYVIGGRGAAVGSATGRISAIDPASGRLRHAGALASPRSDLAAVSVPNGILLAGGRGLGGTSSTIAELSPAATKRFAVAPPAPVSRTNVYAADAAGALSPAVRTARPLVYVPNSQSDTVDEIDPNTYKVVRSFPVGALPQHVTPSYDLKTLYVLNDIGNSLTPIDPTTGLPGKRIPVEDPYNMYYTTDGSYAIVVAERLSRLDFRFPHSFRLHHSLQVPCRGVDHMDFSPDGRYLIATCEFSGQLIKVDVRREKVVGVLTPGNGAIPQDVKLSPDGKVYYVADMGRGGIWEVSGSPFRVLRFIPTGAGTHGLYVSRDATRLYITNRGEGSISVLDLRSRRLVAKWRIPGGGSPDMGNVSANGRVLWLTGRWNDVVYAINTRNGRLLAKIPVGASPHGLCVWPQPGRYSLGHTGILR